MIKIPLIDIMPERISIAIRRLKEFEPPEGYYLAFSGGKDSIVTKKLADLARVKYEAHYSHTTIDPPEIIYFMRKYHSDVKVDYPKKPFLQEMVERGFPDRARRWCCKEYKERGGQGRFVITGIRWAESSRRRQRKMIEFCYKDKSKKYLNVIIDWSDDEVWEFIKRHNMPYCKLYDEGWKRIGCLFCPMSRKRRKQDVNRYPRYVSLFIKYFKKLYDRKKEKGLKSVDRWKDGEEMFWWWMASDPPKRFKDDPFVLFE
jgi:phosphoadenosine phosphosulfate reductase